MLLELVFLLGIVLVREADRNFMKRMFLVGIGLHEIQSVGQERHNSLSVVFVFLASHSQIDVVCVRGKVSLSIAVLEDARGHLMIRTVSVCKHVLKFDTGRFAKVRRDGEMVLVQFFLVINRDLVKVKSFEYLPSFLELGRTNAVATGHGGSLQIKFVEPQAVILYYSVRHTVATSRALR